MFCICPCFPSKHLLERGVLCETKSLNDIKSWFEKLSYNAANLTRNPGPLLIIVGINVLFRNNDTFELSIKFIKSRLAFLVEV